MIRETYIKVKPSNNKARTVFALATSGGIALSVLSTVVPAYSGIVSLAGVVLLVAGIAVFSRFIASVYYYDVTFDSNGIPVFVVRQISGKRDSTLCRIDIADIVSIEEEKAEQRRKHSTPAGYSKYTYVPTLMPSVTLRLTVNSEHENSEIVIEGDSNLSSFLLACSQEARLMRE